MRQRTYIAIDLKSFYASVECVERGLDALSTRLVVADASRTDKTICLAVSPALKAYGIASRPRLFEVVQKVDEVNRLHPEQRIDYLIAKPRMGLYIQYSTLIYGIYLRYVAPEDIHVYSIDEVFMDVTRYLSVYKVSAHDLARTMIREVLQETGITATAGIGTNLYLAKVAMDIVAKHIPADEDGVRIAELNEMTYRQQLWNHMPLSDFWRVGHGIARRLARMGVVTMGQLARLSLSHEELLYRVFGINAELLIDHAWGWEPCTMADIKSYKPEFNSMCSGQVLSCAYNAAQARVVVIEMADQLALDLVAQHRVASSLTLAVSYDRESLTQPDVAYDGPVASDHYGRLVPKPAHGSQKFSFPTSSAREIIQAATHLFDHVVDTALLVRRLNITANNVISEQQAAMLHHQPQQLDLFTDYEELKRQHAAVEEARRREHCMQETLLRIKQKFGKNSILKGTSYKEGATAWERNQQIGGHHE